METGLGYDWGNLDFDGHTPGDCGGIVVSSNRDSLGLGCGESWTVKGQFLFVMGESWAIMRQFYM